MHRSHSGYTNPTCVLCASFFSHTFHFCFDLCRARGVNARPPKERNRDTPTKKTSWAKHHFSVLI